MINSLSVLINFYRQYLWVKRLTDSRSKLWLPLLKKRGQWLSGRVLDSRPRGRGFEPLHCPQAEHINSSLVLVQPRKPCAFITERLLMGCKQSNQTNKQNHCLKKSHVFLCLLLLILSKFSLDSVSREGTYAQARSNLYQFRFNIPDQFMSCGTRNIHIDFNKRYRAYHCKMFLTCSRSPLFIPIKHLNMINIVIGISISKRLNLFLYIKLEV